MSPSISVIILAYREPAFLNALLASLAKQTLPPAQILIVDDASGAEFTAQYQLPPNARLLINEKNLALAAISRNRALQHATGDFVAFIDQDDLWHPEKLAIQSAALIANPAALLCYSHLQSIDEHLRPLPKQPAFKPLGKDPIASLLRTNAIAYSSVMLRRSALAAVGTFDESIRAAADWDLWLRLAAQNGTRSVSAGQCTAPTILADPRPLLLRRHHPRQWSKNPLLMAQAAEKVLAKAATWLPQLRPDLIPLLKNRHTRSLRHLARAHLRAGNPRSAIFPLLQRAATQRPLDLRIYPLMARALFAPRTPP